MLIFIFFVASVSVIVSLIIDRRIDKEMERRREILINQVKSVCQKSDTRFSVSGYFDRMERESQRIRDEIKKKEPYVLTLWWGDDGVRLNDDGTIKWVSKARNTVNNECTYAPYVKLDSKEPSKTIFQFQMYQQMQNAAIIGALQPILCPQWIPAYSYLSSPVQYKYFQY